MRFIKALILVNRKSEIKDIYKPFGDFPSIIATVEINHGFCLINPLFLKNINQLIVVNITCCSLPVALYSLFKIRIFNNFLNKALITKIFIKSGLNYILFLKKEVNMDPNSIQQRMNQIQQDESFSGVLGKLLSGKSGYKPVIEKKYIQPICENCQYKLEDTFKFCPECGAKVEKTASISH